MKKTKKSENSGVQSDQRLKEALRERMKELSCMYSFSKLIESSGDDFEKILTGLVELIPPAWHYPQDTCARIVYEGDIYKTKNFKKGRFKLTADIKVNKKKAGIIEVYYLKPKSPEAKGPFLKEEQKLLEVLAQRLGKAAQEICVSRLLEEKNIHLNALNQQLRASNEEYYAANQQLRAAEQQLRAANQEYSASNEELRATEQQLRAAAQQLKAAEKEILNKQYFLESMINTAQAIILVLSPAGKIISINPFMEKISGYRQEEVKGKDWVTTFLPEGDRNKIKELFKKAMGNVQTKGNINPIRTKDGRQLHIQWYDKTLKDRSGKTIGLLSLGHDITEYRVLELEMKHLASFPQLNPNPVIEVDRAGKVLFTNDAVENILRQMGLKDPKLFIPGNFKDLENELKNHSVTGEVQIKDQVFSSIMYYTPEFDTFRIYAINITQDKKNREALKEAEEKYRILFETMAEGVVYQDAQGKIIMANPSAEKLLGLTFEQLQGRKSIDLRWKSIHEDGLAFPGETHPSMTALKTGKKVNDVIMGVFNPQSNSYKWLNINAVPIFIKEETVPCLVYTTFADITERKKAEEEKEKMQLQFLQSQKAEAVGTLAGGIAHDFNNLLTVILGNSKLAKKIAKPDSDTIVFINEIDIAAQRAATLTNQLLLYTRKQPMGMFPLNVNNTINQTLTIIQRLVGEDIKIDLSLDSAVWVVKANESNIQQLLTNLCVNSRDSMPEGGVITIKSENVILSEEQSRVMAEGKPGAYVCISVMDTGIGMDKETLVQIFEPFFTTKRIGKGTGLGLSVAYGIVKSHNGWINAYSEPASGAIFKIYLPSIEEKCIPVPVKEADLDDLKGSGENILIIEDEFQVLNYIKEMLEKNGYFVFSAGNSKDAISIFGKHSEKINTIVCDMILPDRNGLETVKLLKKIKENISVIFCSGYLDDKSRYQQIQEKGYSFIQKPFEIEVLLKLIKEKNN
ncbi:MAG: hypothetical protein A2252_09695 [Elusimicrobia bacterium RIFOXYA2_FULL_39_19]|nr:MAG: hypothetical protein A2252_09695 [Elusimicrobia bacterium RIFOXYA2_FULL_39_19]